jgi:mevalonate kinase
LCITILCAQQWGLSAADESLSNDQKKAKLEQQLKEINEDIESEIKSKKGLGTTAHLSHTLMDRARA